MTELVRVSRTSDSGSRPFGREAEQRFSPRLAELYKIGSGGSNAEWVQGLILVTLNCPRPQLVETELNLPEEIGFIRHYLSMTVTDLARAMNVQRPTVYAWMGGESDPHHSNLERIGFLREIAKRWRTLADRPVGKLLRTKIEGSNESLLDFISRSDDVATADEFLAEVFALAQKRVGRSVRQRLEDAGLPDKNDEEKSRGLMRALSSRVREGD